MDFFETWRHLLQEELIRYLDEPHGGLLVGILLGLRESMSWEFYQSLIATGTVHVTAVSGLHVSIIAVFLLKICTTIFPKRIGLVFCLFGMWFYALLVGMGPSVVRASTMASLAFTALFFGREYKSGWSLLITIIILVIFVPSFSQDIRFWLSITSTAGIIWISSDIQKGVTGIEKHLVKSGLQGSLYDTATRNESLTKRLSDAVKSDFRTTVAAQVATFPIILIYFGQVSIVSPLVNVLITWLVPYLMIIGTFKLILGVISVKIGYFMGLVSYIPLEMFVRTIEVTSSLPFSHIIIEIEYRVIDKLLMCLVVYLMLFVLLYVVKYRSRK